MIWQCLNWLIAGGAVPYDDVSSTRNHVSVLTEREQIISMLADMYAIHS